MRTHRVAILLAAALAAAPAALAACKECGIVVGVKTVAGSHQVTVRMDDGRNVAFVSPGPTGHKVGDKVKVADKKLVKP